MGLEAPRKDPAEIKADAFNDNHSRSHLELGTIVKSVHKWSFSGILVENINRFDLVVRTELQDKGFGVRILIILSVSISS